MVGLGSLGIAGLLPGRESGAPVWLVVGAVVLPLALFELGAGLVTESWSGSRSYARATAARRWGLRVQVFAALAFLALFVVGMALQPFRMRGVWVIVALASLGVLASAIVLWDFARIARGQSPAAIDPLAAGERIGVRSAGPEQRPGRVRLADALAVVGGTPLLVGLIGLVFVGVIVFAIVVRGREPSREIAIAAAFFVGVALIATAQALERWETFVPSTRIRPIREGVLLLAFLSFGGAMAALGWHLLGHPRESQVKAWLLLSFGGVLVAGGVVYVTRSVLQRYSPRFSSAGYVLAREGILERSRTGILRRSVGEWYLVPWSNVESIALGEFQGMPALYVGLAVGADVEPVYGDAVGVERERKLARRRKSLRFSVNFLGADILVLPPMTSESVGELYRKLEIALSDETARAELPAWRSLVPPLA